MCYRWFGSQIRFPPRNGRSLLIMVLWSLTFNGSARTPCRSDLKKIGEVHFAIAVDVFRAIGTVAPLRNQLDQVTEVNTSVVVEVCGTSGWSWLEGVGATDQISAVGLLVELFGAAVGAVALHAVPSTAVSVDGFVWFSIVIVPEHQQVSPGSQDGAIQF